MEIRYMTVAEIDQDHAQGMEWLKTVQGKSSPSITRNKQRLQDLRDAALAIKRMHPLDSATDDNPEPNPAKVEHWIAAPKDRENLYKHDIIKALANVNEGELRELVADLLVFNVGLVESGIESITDYARNDGKILLPNDKAYSAEGLQCFFNTFGIRKALWWLLEQNEWLLKHKRDRRSKSGESTQPDVGRATKEAIRDEYTRNPGKSVAKFTERLRSEGWSMPGERTVERYTADLRQR